MYGVMKEPFYIPQLQLDGQMLTAATNETLFKSSKAVV